MNKESLYELCSICLWILALGISTSISLFILVWTVRLAFSV